MKAEHEARCPDLIGFTFSFISFSWDASATTRKACSCKAKFSTAIHADHVFDPEILPSNACAIRPTGMLCDWNCEKRPYLSVMLKGPVTALWPPVELPLLAEAP